MSLPLSYVLDAGDRVIGVSDNWDLFAEENNGNRAVAARVLGASLWDQISDQSLRVILRMVLRKVRSSGALRFHFRCDSPEQKRTHEMRVVRTANGCVEFSSQEVAARSTPALALEEHGEHAAMITVCSWCDRVRMPTADWVSVDVALDQMGYLEHTALPQVTHGICATCRAIAFDQWLHGEAEST